MCGIAGSFNFQLSAVEISRMSNLLHHRGPDEHYTWNNQKASLVIQRLAIQDIANQKQPFLSEDKNYICIFNGEIYNHVALREELVKSGHEFASMNGDGEVIVHLYEEFGIEGFNKLEGMFGGCILDLKEQELHLFRDIFGIKPLYYRQDANLVTFASEIAPLLTNETKNSLELENMKDFLIRGYISAPDTSFQGVKQILPGHVFTFDAKGNCRKTFFYKQNDSKIDFSKSGSDYLASKLQSLIRESVDEQIPSEVSFGIFLSGGLDSSLIGKLASELTVEKFHTFTITYPELNHKGKLEDLRWANTIAKELGSEHHEVDVCAEDVIENFSSIVESTGDPFGGVFSSYFLSKYASRFVKVVLTGDGADELFGSYFFHRVARMSDVFTDQLTAQDLNFLNCDYEHFLRLNATTNELGRRYEDFRYFLSEFAPNSSLLNSRAEFNFEAQIINYQYTQNSQLKRSLFYDFNDLLPNNVLFYADRYSMRFGLEARPPFLTKKIFEFAKQLPDDLLVNGHQTKLILKQASKGILPEALIHRAKEGFVSPISFWLRNELYDWTVFKLTKCSTSIATELIGKNLLIQFLAKLKQEPENHRLANFLWRTLILQEWFQLNKDKIPDNFG